MSYDKLAQRIAFHKREIWLRASLDAETGKPKLEFCVIDDSAKKGYLISNNEAFDVKTSQLANEGVSMFTKEQPYIKPFFSQEVPQCFKNNYGYERLHNAVVPLVFKKALVELQNIANSAHWKAKTELDESKAVLAQSKSGGAEL